jgi:hypothetical protein
MPPKDVREPTSLITAERLYRFRRDPGSQILPSLDLFRPTVTLAPRITYKFSLTLAASGIVFITLRRPASGFCLPALGDQSPALVGKRLKQRGLDLA